jgi:LPXTG-motif cell wall-anchored protein
MGTLGVVGLVLLGLSWPVGAQVKTDTATESGQPMQVIEVERGEVVYVSGRNLMVKMEDGTLRSFTNVPEDLRATVDGKQLGIRDLKPGMKLQRTITTTMTPQVVTTVQSVTGTVFSVSPPKSVVLTLEDGTNQSFTIPEGQKFDVGVDKQVDAFGLKRGMKVAATKIVQVPATAVATQRAVSGTMPPPPPPPNVPVLIAQSEPTPAPAAAPAATPASLPETGSALPLLGLAGAASLLLGLFLAVVRRSL